MPTLGQLTVRILLFSLLWLVLFPYLVTHTEAIHYLEKHYLLGGEVYTAIDCSNSKVEKGTVIVMGDSVARQLYGVGAYREGIYSLASNQAISLAGQYVLLHNLLKNNRSAIAKVYLVMHPLSFRNDLDQVFVYNYFIKPFYLVENFQIFSEHTMNKIDQVPLYFTSFLPVTRMTNFTPNLTGYDQPVPASAAEKKYRMSFVSLEYLRRMNSELADAGIAFEVVAPVLNDEYQCYDSEDLKKALAANGLTAPFSGYFPFRYLDRKRFVDPLHYASPGDFGPDPLRLGTPALSAGLP